MRWRSRSALLAVTISTLLAFATVATSQTAVTPVSFTPEETKVLLDKVKAGLIRDRQLEAQYTYLEKRRDVKVSGLGKVSLGEARTFEVYPSVEPGRTYKRLIAINDKPLPPAELATRDAAHRQRLEDEARKRSAETPEQTRIREARTKARIARQRREVEDAFNSYTYQVEGRESLEGHPRPLLRVKMTPNQAYRATTNNDFVKYAKKFTGVAWVDEQDGQVVRIRAEATDGVNIGLGIVGRVNKGSVATFERRKVNGEVWLPWRAKLDVTGRAAIFRRFDFETETTWWDYKKFSVETDVVGVRRQ